MNYVRMTYFHSLYKRNETVLVCGGIEFSNGMCVFKSGGRGYAVPVQNIVSIEPVGEGV